MRCLCGRNRLRRGFFFHTHQLVAHVARLSLEFCLHALDSLGVPLPPDGGIVFHLFLTIV